MFETTKRCRWAWARIWLWRVTAIDAAIRPKQDHRMVAEKMQAHDSCIPTRSSLPWHASSLVLPGNRSRCTRRNHPCGVAEKRRQALSNCPQDLIRNAASAAMENSRQESWMRACPSLPNLERHSCATNTVWRQLRSRAKSDVRHLDRIKPYQRRCQATRAAQIAAPPKAHISNAVNAHIDQRDASSRPPQITPYSSGLPSPDIRRSVGNSPLRSNGSSRSRKDGPDCT